MLVNPFDLCFQKHLCQPSRTDALPNWNKKLVKFKWIFAINSKKKLIIPKHIIFNTVPKRGDTPNKFPHSSLTNRF